MKGSTHWKQDFFLFQMSSLYKVLLSILRTVAVQILDGWQFYPSGKWSVLSGPKGQEKRPRSTPLLPFLECFGAIFKIGDNKRK